MGDNAYPDSLSTTMIDTDVGQYYHDFIYPYKGTYGAGATTNRFWPSLGNHDWGNDGQSPNLDQPYLSYFTLPGNGRYYKFSQGPVDFFVVDADGHEPDGNTSTSIQAAWFEFSTPSTIFATSVSITGPPLR